MGLVRIDKLKKLVESFLHLERGEWYNLKKRVETDEGKILDPGTSVRYEGNEGEGLIHVELIDGSQTIIPVSALES